MVGEVLFEFMTNVFHQCLAEKNTSFAVVLFIDEHPPHLILDTSKICDEHGIILVALLPNDTHITSFSQWTLGLQTTEEWVEEASCDGKDSTLKKEDFAKLLNTAINNSPWDPSAVDTNKTSAKSSTQLDATNLRPQHILTPLAFKK
ncbi:hypothetical protein PR048_015567 [Dryococelus australis]|uniref:DDE-1 domain-containing protein n=1 Tax=Dryococelus australis TaxID=614101 RepID=A0ABQ9HHB2_9NEOP|nr:hypothetical protein PR048_015567 [Dryococelus australis]